MQLLVALQKVFFAPLLLRKKKQKHLLFKKERKENSGQGFHFSQ